MVESNQSYLSKVHLIDIKNQQTAKRVSTQMGRIVKAFYGGSSCGKTMLMVARETGIERASICRRVDELRGKNAIWPCGKRICPVSKDRAMHYTTNYRVAVSYFINITRPYWENLPSKDAMRVLDAISVYVTQHEFNEFLLEDRPSAFNAWFTIVTIINMELE